MCFEVKKGSRAKIAKKDIECWKIIENDNSFAFLPVHGIRGKYVKHNVMPNVSIRVRRGEIYAGYHSCKEEENECSISNIKYGWGCKNVKFIIPAGTRYYENDTEYVSETIMML